MVVDTDVIINYIHGAQPAKLFLDGLTEQGEAETHSVVAAELLVGAANAIEMRQYRRGISGFRVIAPSESDAERSIELLIEHKLRDGVGWPDCLIAATCLRLGLVLATLNEKHFRVFHGLSVIRPY